MKNRWAKMFNPNFAQVRKKKPPTYDRDFHNASMNSSILVRKPVRTLEDFSEEELAEIQGIADIGIKVETGRGFVKVKKEA